MNQEYGVMSIVILTKDLYRYSMTEIFTDGVEIIFSTVMIDEDVIKMRLGLEPKKQD